MSHSGVDVSDELDNSEWERCPDWNARPVIRISHNRVPWIFWLGSHRFLDGVSSSQHLGGRGWYQAELEEASQAPTEIQFFVDDSEYHAGCVWLGVELRGLQSVDLLVDRFGQPPQEVRRDWYFQRVCSSTTEPSSDLLSHFLVTTDGRLFSLSSVEAIILERLSSNTANPMLDFGVPIPGERCLRDAPLAPLTSRGTLEELVKGDLAAIETIKSTAAPKESSLVPNGLLDQKSPSQPNILTKSTVGGFRSPGKPSHRRRIPTAFYTYAGISAALLVVIVGLGAWMSRPAQQQVVQLEPGPSQMNDGKSEGEALVTAVIEQQEAPAPLEISRDLESLPDGGLESQASSSLESFMGQITGGKPPASIDSISFESVTKALNQTSDEAIVQESLAEVRSENPLDLSKTTKPFAESLDEAATKESMEETASALTNASEKPGEPPIAPGFLTQSMSIRQAQYKTKIQVPFKLKPNDQQAVCRVKLAIADDLLLQPAEAVELVGRQDTVWTVALNDDSVHLHVYLRSIPAKSWYIATAVRLKLGNGTEVPISKNEATQVCLRLQNYLRWLDQSRQVGESMRSNKKTRSMAISGLEQIEKQTKSTEKSLKSWLVIEKLVRAFYEVNSIELELASSNEMLPAT